MMTALCLSAVSLGLAAYGGVPQGVRAAAERDLRRRCTAARALVLTYDDGPGERLTPALLDLLRERGVSATFFLLGSRANAHPGVVERMLADGHELGCHTQGHLHAWKTWPWRGVGDIRDGYATLARWVPPNAPFRPPYGKMTLASWLAVRRRGAPIGWWTVDSTDTRDAPGSPEATVEAVSRAGGGVVLLHDFDRGPERHELVLRTTGLLLDLAARERMTVLTLGALMRTQAESASRRP